MMEVNYLEMLQLALPEIILVLTALAVLGADLISLRREALPVRMGLGSALAAAGCVAAAAVAWLSEGTGDVGHGMFVVSPLIRWVKVGLLALAVPTLVLSGMGRFTRHAGEYIAMILFAVLGMLFLVSAEDLVMVFLALEMTSLSLYILTAFNKQDPRSAEAALKYFLFGGMSAALALFGFSLVYGMTGTTRLESIAAALPAHAGDPLLYVAIVGVVAGLGFKIAAVPFHLWAPDAYEGAPTPSAALVATGSKIASFFILAKLMGVGLAGTEGSAAWMGMHAGWGFALGLIAAGSMVFGNLAALAQTGVKRLLAYSAVAHAGYMLIAVVANSDAGLSALLYYVFVYGVATLGAFTVVVAVEQSCGGDALRDFAGLARRSPLLALSLLVFLLSLAGIPPLAGFFGKFYVFLAAVDSGQQMGLLWLVVLGIATSVVSLYYYLMVLKEAYVREPTPDEPGTPVPVVTTLCAAALAATVILLGCFPSWILDLISASMTHAH